MVFRLKLEFFHNLAVNHLAKLVEDINLCHFDFLT